MDKKPGKIKISTAIRNNVKVPKELGIASIGSADVSNLLDFKITTINTNQHEMGRVAASKLIDRINKIKFDKRIFDVGISIVKGFSL